MRAPSSLRLVPLVLALSAVPTALHAQASLGRIQGVVRDSVHGGPAIEVPVLAMRLSPEPPMFVSAVTDSAGRFHLDSLPAGRYAVSFSTPLLDSLGLGMPDREVVLGERATETIELAVPSGVTLRAATCPGLALGAGKGGVAGFVRDAESERALAGATVVVGWTDLSVDRATLRAATEQRTGAVKTDSLGRYRLCGVPTDQRLNLQVQHAGAAGSVVQVMVNDSTGVARLDLSFGELSTAAAPDTTPAPDGVRLPKAKGTAALTGVVLSASGRPIADVELRVALAQSVVHSDSLGRYTLTDLPSGTQMLEARRIGFAPTRIPVELRSARTTEQRVQLTNVVSLDSVRVVARRTRYKEFERNRRNGFGRFMDEEAILRKNPIRTSDLLRMTPGFRIVSDGFDDVVVSSRGAMSMRQRSCRANVVIDGMQHMLISDVHPSDIGALEVYTGPAGAPPQYDSACGVIVIWTKR